MKKEKIALSMWIKVLAFNIGQTASIFATGFFLLNLSIVEMLIISFLFWLPRMVLSGPSHFKSPFKCFIVSLILMFFIFTMYYIEPVLGYLCSIFTGVLLTEKGNISNLYQFQPEKPFVNKNKEVIEFVKNNFATNDRLIKYEKYLNEVEKDIEYSNIYTDIFKKGISQNQYARYRDKNIQRVGEYVKTIAHNIKSNYM